MLHVACRTLRAACCMLYAVRRALRRRSAPLRRQAALKKHLDKFAGAAPHAPKYSLVSRALGRALPPSRSPERLSVAPHAPQN
jgi:hypothetical protein